MDECGIHITISNSEIPDTSMPLFELGIMNQWDANKIENYIKDNPDKKIKFNFSDSASYYKCSKIKIKMYVNSNDQIQLC